MNQKFCEKCGSVSLYTELKGNNTGLYCGECGAWIKWLNKNERRAFEHNHKLKSTKIIEDNIKTGKWIPCCERLPESEEPEILCLVTYQEYNIFEMEWECEKIGVLAYMTKQGIWNTKALIKVHAWMPIPEPYKIVIK